jgi:hypothetical protein
LQLAAFERTIQLGIFFNSSQGDFMGDKSPKSKAKDQKHKNDVKDKAGQKAEADRAAQAANNPKPKK